MAHLGSLVFNKPPGPVPLTQFHHWWAFTIGADWRHPLGPDSDIDSLDLWDHPVVQVAHSDAKAYANWARKALPTEAEHEFAARCGLDGKEFAWGDELNPDGEMLANYWQGEFPHANTLEDGWERTSPGPDFSAQRPRAIRHDWQRVGMNERLVERATERAGEGQAAVLLHDQ